MHAKTFHIQAVLDVDEKGVVYFFVVGLGFS